MLPKERRELCWVEVVLERVQTEGEVGRGPRKEKAISQFSAQSFQLRAERFLSKAGSTALGGGKSEWLLSVSIPGKHSSSQNRPEPVPSSAFWRVGAFWRLPWFVQGNLNTFSPEAESSCLIPKSLTLMPVSRRVRSPYSTPLRLAAQMGANTACQVTP